MVEALLCMQDWIRADIRSRDKKENVWDELEYYKESEKIVQGMYVYVIFIYLQIVKFYY